MKNFNTPHKTLSIALALLLMGSAQLTQAQNSLVEGGWGGRLWYQPVNLSVGSYSAYTVCSGTNRQLYGWGNGVHGSLGNNSVGNSDVPVACNGDAGTADDMTNVKYYTAGYNVGAIKMDNTGWFFGKGDLFPGLATAADAIPTQVLTDVRFVDAGVINNSYVKWDGTVWSVGKQNYSMFGDGNSTTPFSHTAVQMAGITNAVRVAVGTTSIMVLLADGTLKATGRGAHGQLGNGIADVDEYATPQEVIMPGGGVKFCDIKGSAMAYTALATNGDVYFWGLGGHGDGNGGFFDVTVPTKITTLSNIVAISACDDGDTFLALDTDGNVWAWGQNGYGNCGDGTTTDIDVAKQVYTASAGVKAIDIMAGETFSYIVTSTSNCSSVQLYATGETFSVRSSDIPDDNIFMDGSNVRHTNFIPINPTGPWSLGLICGVAPSPSVYDAGDAPFSYDVVTAGDSSTICRNYISTTSTSICSNSGSTLYMGTNPAGYPTFKNTYNNVAAAADNNGSNGDGLEEDGVSSWPMPVTGSNYSISVKVTNTTGATANLYAWIDWNNNGKFEVGEAATTTVATGVSGGTVTLTWPGAVVVGNSCTTGAPATNRIYARLRLTSSTLTDDPISSTPAYDERALGTADGGEVEDYSFLVSTENRDYGNLTTATWPIAYATVPTSNAAWLGGTVALPASGQATVECATNTSDPADGFTITDAISGAGTQASPWVLSGAGGTYNYNITVNGSGTAKPVYYGIWYDANNNFSFNDAQDIFISGSQNHGSPVTVSGSFNLLTTGTNAGATLGKIRVIGVAVDPTFTKAMGNTTMALTNGEVEDYYVSYTTPLPITLTKFTATLNNCAATLSWQTASELNSKNYIVQQSADGVNYVQAASIASKNDAAGSSYSYKVGSLFAGINYFRLKAVDADGKFTYSNITTVRSTCKGAITITPNPTSDIINIAGLSGKNSIQIFNTLGQKITETQSVDFVKQISLAAFAKGVYTIRIVDAQGAVTNAKVVKE